MSAITGRRGRGSEPATVAGAFLVYGSVFFDRLAPLYLVSLIAADLGVPSAAEGTLALLIGLGWAAAMPLLRATSGRFGDRDRIVFAALAAALCGAASVLVGSWLPFILLRGLGGLAAGSGAPAVTALVFGVAPRRRRGLDLGIVQSSTRLVGSLLSPIVVTAVAVASGWRAALATSAGLLVVGAIALALAVPRRARRARHHAPAAPFSLRPGGRRNIALSALACSVLLTWLTVWSQSAVPLVSGWLDAGTDAAGRLVGLFGVGAGLAALLTPIASDRVGRRGALAAATGIGGAGGVSLAALAGTATVPARSFVVLVIVLGGVAMGALPLVISLIPAETVASGDVGRALLVPIASAEIVGSAALPALAAAAAVPFGLPAVLGVAAAMVLTLVAVSRLIVPLDTKETTGPQPVSHRSRSSTEATRAEG